MDFDGVMTDGCVYVDQDGREMVKCSRKDGLGIALLKKHDIKVAVISKETNPVVAARCQKLQIQCEQAIATGEDKLAVLKRMAQAHGLDLEQVAYIGDDFNDIDVLQAVGLAITVADGQPSVKEVCSYITQAAGGQHAVREACEKILLSQGVRLKF